MNEYRMLSVTAIHGYGFPVSSLEAGMSRKPDMIGADGGSVDPGPYYLGIGEPFCSKRAIRRDLQLMLRAAIEHNIPLVMGTCGGAGGEPHLQLLAGMARDIAREDGLHFKMALIHAEQDKGDLKKRLREKKIHPLGRMAELEEETIDRAERVVAMMGPEPFMAALEAGAQVILAGRSSDPAPWAACAQRAQISPAPAWFAGKMLECAATASIPKGHDCLLVTVTDDYVECEAPNPERACTPLSVANHSLHENPSPIHHIEPGGLLDTANCKFEAVSDRATRISGMEWTPADPYTVKLEAAELAAYRAFTICGTRDPLLIETLDDFLGHVRDNTASKAADFGAGPDDYKLIIRTYGRDGVMGEREPLKNNLGHEVGFLVEVVADDQETANSVLSISRTQMLHTDFPGRMCREGNMAFPFSPSDVEAGPVYRFSMHHVLDVEDPLVPFPIEYEIL